jgi:hypothetical protein
MEADPPSDHRKAGLGDRAAGLGAFSAAAAVAIDPLLIGTAALRGRLGNRGSSQAQYTMSSA